MRIICLKQGNVCGKGAHSDTILKELSTCNHLNLKYIIQFRINSMKLIICGLFLANLLLIIILHARTFHSFFGHW